jgi:Ca2+/H+ antiporter
MLAALLLAAEAAGKSKTPFYILAGVLIVFGFALGIGGSLRHGTFPSSDGAARAVMAVAVLLVAGTMVTAVLTA